MILPVALDIMDRDWEWGVADCCTAASDVFRRLHGVDPMAPLRGRYASQRSAWRLIRKHGGWDAMTAELAARAGLSEGVGAPGEIGLAQMIEGTHALVICVAPGRWAGKSETGLRTVPAAAVGRSWRG